MMKPSTHHLLLVCFLVLAVFEGCEAQARGLQYNFYEKSCPNAEAIVRRITWSHASTNPVLPAKFLRMHFHDCFVRGCDASILLDSTPNNSAEKEAIPNLSLAGFDVIDDIKAELEKQCPGKVSCADILALAARDAVSFQFRRLMWEVLTGRRDGNISQKSEALVNLPPPFFNFSSLNQSFSGKGLSVHDLVVLSGGHTIGRGHCNFFSNRLYNFTGNGGQDPSLNPAYAAFLKTQCKNLTDTTSVDMDPRSAQSFDSHYYVILQQKEGMFQSDAALLTNQESRNIVNMLVNRNMFFREFGKSMMKMGAIKVLTGTAGEIRKNCRVIN